MDRSKGGEDIGSDKIWARPFPDRLWLREVPGLLDWFEHRLSSRLFPMLQSLYPEIIPSATDLRCHDAFVVRYDAGGMAGLELHQDTTSFSFTMCVGGRYASRARDFAASGLWAAGLWASGLSAAGLWAAGTSRSALNALEDYDGGGTVFPELRAAAANTAGTGSGTGSGAGSGASCEPFERTSVRADIGGVCSFPGRLFHGGNDVTRGCRYIIPLFIYLDFNRSGKRRGYILDAASIPPPSLDGVDSHPGWGVGSRI